MEYNSTREQLMFTEYGRNVQNLVRHALTIEDRKKRQSYIEYLVMLVEQLNPQARSIRDDKEKLWKQIFAMTDFKLDVDTPEGMVVNKETIDLKPSPIPYPPKNPRFRHYGQHIQHMITKAIEMEEGKKKEEYIWVIASYMKLAYQNYNDNYNVSDEMIRSDLKLLSKGLLSLPEEKAIDYLTAIGKVPENTNERSKNSGSKRKKKHHKRNHYKNRRRH